MTISSSVKKPPLAATAQLVAAAVATSRSRNLEE